MQDRQRIPNVFLQLFLLSGLLALVPAWAEDCVRSVYAVNKNIDPVYISLSPFPSGEERLDSTVLHLPLSRLRASRAFRDRHVVLMSDAFSTDERQAVCVQLKGDGFARVTFLRERTSDLRVTGRRLVLRRLPAHGWKTLDPADAHRMLGSTDYLAVKLGGFEASDEEEEFVSVQSLERVLELAAREPRQILVFEAVPTGQPPVLSPDARKMHLWWVDGGLPSYREYQTQLTLSLLSRETPERVCPL